MLRTRLRKEPAMSCYKNQQNSCFKTSETEKIMFCSQHLHTNVP